MSTTTTSKYSWICVLILLFSSMSGCTGSRLSHNLVGYVNQDILNISQLEIIALKHYAAVTGNNFTTNERVYKALKNDIIPYYKRFTELLREISPDSIELKRVHANYIHGSEKIYNGFVSKMIGLENKDASLIRLANHQINSGREEITKWQGGLFELFKETGVVHKKAGDG